MSIITNDQSGTVTPRPVDEEYIIWAKARCKNEGDVFVRELINRLALVFREKNCTTDEQRAPLFWSILMDLKKRKHRGLVIQSRIRCIS